MCEHLFVMIVDLKDITTDELAATADQLHGLMNAVRVQYLHVVAEIDRRRAYAEDGMGSAEDWTTYRYGMNRATAREEVEVARVLEENPRVQEAVANGEICWDKVRELARFLEPADDEFWAKDAPMRNYAQVRAWARHAQGMKREKLEQDAQARYVKMGWNLSSGFLRISGRIPGADGAAVKAVFDRIAEQSGPDENGWWEPLEKRRADALVELSRLKLAQDADIDRALVTVTVTARDLNHVHGIAELEYGPLVPSEVARKLSCDGSVQVVTVDDTGTPIGIGRRSRVVPPWLYRLVKQRDKGCVCCGNTRGVQAHHKIHWAHGGRTDLDNLVLMCWRCHDLIHRKRFKLRKGAGGNYDLVRPDGRLVKRTPTPLRPDIRQRMLGPPNRVG